MSYEKQPDLADMARALKQIEIATMAIASTNPPNWRRPLTAYTADWVSAIGAYAVATDAHGPAAVWWCGHTYTRRTGGNAKYGAAIWYSRSMGKNEAGESQYARLITFTDGAETKAEPLPEYVLKAMRR